MKIIEIQEHFVHSTERHEKHQIALVSPPQTADNIEFAFVWSNSNGDTKQTPMRTMAGHAEDHGASVKSLLETQEEFKNFNLNDGGFKFKIIQA